MLHQKRAFRLQLTILLALSLFFSGCVENKVAEANFTTDNSIAVTEEIKIIKGSSDKTIILPEGIEVADWKIAVDRILLTIKNTDDSAVFLNKVGTDVSFNNNMSTFRHYEATMDLMLGAEEEKTIYIRIHKLSDWDKPIVKTIEVT